MPDLADQLATITYKDGWEFQVHEGPDGLTRLIIEAWAVDAYDQTRTVRIHRDFLTMRPEEHFLQWVWHCITEAEIHEASEFFHVDGIKPYDPHRARRPSTAH